MNPVIVVDENIPGVPELLAGVADIRIASGRDIDAATLVGAQALLIRSVTTVNKALLAGSQLRFIGSATSGVDHVDLDYLAQQGISFAHAPGSNANSVVEYVLAAIAAIPGKLEKMLAGGRLGIIGFGIIGKLLASRLRRLDIEFCAYDPWLGNGLVENAAELEEVLACDVVSLHAELTRRQPWPSHHLLGSRELSCLNPDALLINASRGSVIDNAALLASMQRGDLGARVVLDVWEGEPGIDHALLQRVALGTSHIAGYSFDGKLMATRMLCESLASALGLDLAEPGKRELPGLTLAREADDVQLVRKAILGRYDIETDDAMLRAVTLGHQPAEAAAGFDRLRREYPRRRELFGTEVSVLEPSERQQQLLRALGCVLPKVTSNK